jgi:hypothetical protein
MKTINNLLIITILTLCASCNSNEPGKKEETKPDVHMRAAGTLAAEDSIDMSEMALDETYGIQQFTLLSTYLEIDNVAVPAEIMDSISLVAFDTLKYESRSLAGTGRHVNAVQIHHGVDANNRMQLVYTPVCLTHSVDFYDGHLNRIGTYSIIPSSKTYTYNTAQRRFDQVNASVAATFTDAYRENMRLKRTPAGEFEVYQDGDVTSVIFPYQEIETLAAHNYSGGGDKRIHVCNAVKTQTISGTEYIKHSLILAVDSLVPFTDTTDFRGKFANLAHLCPPSCGLVIYKLK